jgi:GNAT superfamily N-acetyltransferase
MTLAEARESAGRAEGIEVAMRADEDQPTRAADGLTVRRLPADDATIRRWAEPIAAVTRRAYAGSDPVPGLPVPDGARARTEEVVADLRAGTIAWLALEPDGTPAGVVRVRDHGADGWEVSRVATVPSSKRRGVARHILREVERSAASAGTPRVWLNAVVERCLPAFYARLGYHVIDHWPSPDKDLTEVTMARDPAAPARPEEFPWAAIPPPSGPVTCWFTADGALWLAIVDRADGIFEAVRRAAETLAARGLADPRLAGADLTAGDIPHPRLLLAGVGAGEADVRRVAADRLSVRAHLTPRALHPGLLAFWRLPPGHECALPTGGES